MHPKGKKSPSGYYSYSHLSSRSGRDFWSKFWAWECIAFGVDLLQILREFLLV
ncbi:MAG: hypothetical protein RMI93_02325 [Caldimicrobium sp.]|nr:hypothetical protein [Caldimicrobium sp.]MDW8182428.1 hypothetical protein [Caldimicrobium sp.]